MLHVDMYWQAGRGRSAAENQQSTESKVLKKTRRHVICRKADVQHRTYATKKLALAMKTSLGLSWSQHRTQKRFLREVGVNFDNEQMSILTVLRQPRNHLCVSPI